MAPRAAETAAFDAWAAPSYTHIRMSGAAACCV